MNYERIEREIELITNYLGNGGYFNPELMEHNKVRDMVMANRESLRLLLDVARAADIHRHLRDCNCGMCRALTALKEHCDE